MSGEAPATAGERVLVCGGRDYRDAQRVIATMNRLYPRPVIVLQGGAPGADSLAFHWACANGVQSETFLADWRRHGRAAGPIRNARMLAEGRPTLVIAFPGGRGTADMVRQAHAAGVEVREVGGDG